MINECYPMYWRVGLDSYFSNAECAVIYCLENYIPIDQCRFVDVSFGQSIKTDDKNKNNTKTIRFVCQSILDNISHLSVDFIEKTKEEQDEIFNLIEDLICGFIHSVVPYDQIELFEKSLMLRLKWQPYLLDEAELCQKVLNLIPENSIVKQKKLIEYKDKLYMVVNRKLASLFVTEHTFLDKETGIPSAEKIIDYLINQECSIKNDPVFVQEGFYR